MRRKTRGSYRDRSGWNEQIVFDLYQRLVKPNIDFTDTNLLQMIIDGRSTLVLNNTLQSMNYPSVTTANRHRWTFWKYLHEISDFVEQDAQPFIADYLRPPPVAPRPNILQRAWSGIKSFVKKILGA